METPKVDYLIVELQWQKEHGTRITKDKLELLSELKAIKQALSLAPVSLVEQSETAVCPCITHWCGARDKDKCSINDFDCEDRQTGN